MVLHTVYYIYNYFMNLLWVVLLLSCMHMLKLLSVQGALIDSIRKTSVLLFLISCLVGLILWQQQGL